MSHTYTLHKVTRPQAQLAAGELLATAPSNTVLCIGFGGQSVTAMLSQVDHIFTDADGTITDEGAEQLSAEKVNLIRQLSSVGVGVTVVTGKPLAEIAPFCKTLPAGTLINFICEKGAYAVHFDASGAWREFILSNTQQEQAVAALRQQFVAFSKTLVDQYGASNLGFGWGGSGEHKSIISIDIFASQPPKNYLGLRGKDREALKLKSPDLLANIEQQIEHWVHKQQPDWRVVHIGNANTEISPGGIGKREAIVESAEFGAARKVLILGDSLNDRGMFTLHSAFEGKALTSLVLHRAASLPLVDMADFVTFGITNSDPILHAVIAAHHSAL